MGEFFVEGQVGIAQFFGQGGWMKVDESDADTVKLQVQPTRAYYVDHQTSERTEVNWLAKGLVRGRETKPVLDKNGLLTLRIQWVDAPELHYQGYRQPYGFRATDELAKYLTSKTGQSVVPAVARTIVYEPGEAFDTYGRCVSTLEIHVGSEVINVNDWLLSEGWALPAFYNSMTPKEIVSAIELAKIAREVKKGIWGDLSRKLQPATLHFSKKIAKMPLPDDDAGKFNFPKIFRRTVMYNSEKMKGKSRARTLHAWLAQREKKTHEDKVILSKNFLDNRLTTDTHFFSEFIAQNGGIKFNPADLVFTEAKSELFDKDTNKPILDWNYA